MTDTDLWQWIAVGSIVVAAAASVAYGVFTSFRRNRADDTDRAGC